MCSGVSSADISGWKVSSVLTGKIRCCLRNQSNTVSTVKCIHLEKKLSITLCSEGMF